MSLDPFIYAATAIDRLAHAPSSPRLPCLHAQLHATNSSCLPNMVRPLTKVVYQPDTTLTNEYVVLVNPDEVRAHPVACKMHAVT